MKIEITIELNTEAMVAALTICGVVAYVGGIWLLR